MLIDARESEDEETIEADLCSICGGAAGITIGRALIGSPADRDRPCSRAGAAHRRQARVPSGGSRVPRTIAAASAPVSTHGTISP